MSLINTILEGVPASHMDNPALIAAHICSALSRSQQYHISQTSCQALLDALSRNSGAITVPESTDPYAQLIAYFSSSLAKNQPLKRISNLVLVVDDPVKRGEVLCALDIILHILQQLKYLSNLPRYAVRYETDKYFCRRRFHQITRLENNDSPNNKALIAEAQAYPNRFLLYRGSSELREKICVKGCSRSCPDAKACLYRDFLDELRKGDFTIQFYSSPAYIRDVLRCQSGKRSGLPQHSTVMFLDDLDKQALTVQRAMQERLRAQALHSFLLQCERLCGTKKAYKASVCALTGRLRSSFDALVLCLDGEDRGNVEQLLMELAADMDTLEQKCRALFQDKPRIDMLHREICRLLAVFLSENVELYISDRGDILSKPLLDKRLCLSSDAKSFLLQTLIDLGIQSIVFRKESSVHGK